MVPPAYDLRDLRALATPNFPKARISSLALVLHGQQFHVADELPLEDGRNDVAKLLDTSADPPPSAGEDAYAFFGDRTSSQGASADKASVEDRAAVRDLDVTDDFIKDEPKNVVPDDVVAVRVPLKGIRVHYLVAYVEKIDRRLHYGHGISLLCFVAEVFACVKQQRLIFGCELAKTSHDQGRSETEKIYARERTN